MDTGTKISGAAHFALVGWIGLGAWFEANPPPIEVQAVSVITAEDFAAMTASMQPPDVGATPVVLPVAPSEPEVEPVTEPVSEPVTPDVASEPVIPEPLTPEPVTPEAEVEPPQPTQPEVVVELQDTTPETSPRPIERIAPVPVATPPLDATPSEVETPAVNADEGATTPQEESQAQAPDEATTEIVPEVVPEVVPDATASLAPARSPRPPKRPKRPERSESSEQPTGPDPAEAQDTPDDQGSPAEDGVRDALAEALGTATQSAPVPVGPPLTGGEKDALRIGVSACWNVGSLSSAALRTTVVVSVEMNRDGKPQASSIRMISSSGGPDTAAKQAYEAARRAIIRCGAKGFKLPPEKYGQWRDIEMTFKAEGKQIQ